MEAKELMYRTPVGNYSPEEANRPDNLKDRPTVYAFGVKSEVHRNYLKDLFNGLGLSSNKAEQWLWFIFNIV